MVDSTDLAQVLHEAQDIARSAEHALTSAHLLLALFTVENRAQLLLREKGVTEDKILEHMPTHDPERDGLVRTLCMRAREIAQTIGSREADCMHLLVVFTRVPCTAKDLLAKTCSPLSTLNNVALSYCTSGLTLRHLPPGSAAARVSMPRPSRPPGSPPSAPPATTFASSVVRPLPPVRVRSSRPAISPRDLIDEVNDPGPIEADETAPPSSQDISTPTHQEASSPRVLATRSERARTKVFIGHGHSDAWRALSTFLKDKLDLDPQEFNSVPIAGKHTIERLKELLDECEMAFLVMTAEDEGADGKHHARLNVIHEVGLFQGKLGFDRAIILFERGCGEFSNIAGLGCIKFPRNRIEECFDKVRATVESRLPARTRKQ